METQNYWEVMGVSQDADLGTLRAAYDKLSLRFHPDRHARLRGTPHEALLGDVYRRIGEAYRVLRHDNTRRKYIRQLSSGSLRYDDSVREKTGPTTLEELSQDMGTRKFLRLADQALASGNPAGALQNLKFAASMEADNQDIQERIAALLAEQ